MGLAAACRAARRMDTKWIWSKRLLNRAAWPQPLRFRRRLNRTASITSSARPITRPLSCWMSLESVPRSNGVHYDDGHRYRRQARIAGAIRLPSCCRFPHLSLWQKFRYGRLALRFRMRPNDGGRRSNTRTRRAGLLRWCGETGLSSDLLATAVRLQVLPGTPTTYRRRESGRAFVASGGRARA